MSGYNVYRQQDEMYLIIVYLCKNNMAPFKPWAEVVTLDLIRSTWPRYQQLILQLLLTPIVCLAEAACLLQTALGLSPEDMNDVVCWGT